MFEEIFNKCKVNLSNKQKKEIKEEYTHAISEAGNSELECVEKEFNEKNSVLKESRIQWDRKLSEVYATLYQILVKSEDGEINLRSDTKKHIIAALFYFVEPYDIICDYTPGIGYIDDAYIVSLCVRYLQKKESKLFKKFFAIGKEGMYEKEVAKKTAVNIWTKTELSTLRKEYPKADTKDIAGKLGRTLEAVRFQAKKYGLKKTKNYMQSLYNQMKR
tara:strand:- start:1388 stop:2041 length:654 start_codon:yes stop_codon:yes gene_type:complete